MNLEQQYEACEMRLGRIIHDHMRNAEKSGAKQLLEADLVWTRIHREAPSATLMRAYQQFFGVPEDVWTHYEPAVVCVSVRVLVSRFACIADRGFVKRSKVSYHIPTYSPTPTIVEITSTGKLRLSDGQIAHPLWVWRVQ